ncbi:MAG: oligosaccharide flippase family protein [Syntrophaceae bacterium]|nr:oligosaccharide flippase family protein [Syntrophaceae bacterium]
MKFLQHKLTTDIAWSMGSLVILAASGILINLIIAAFRDASALGAFNQAYAIYIVASQIAVFGLHYSVLRHAALYDRDAEERSRLLVNASAWSLLLGVSAAAMVFTAAPLFGWILDSDSVKAATANAALGLTLFPLNKVLLGYLNGLRLMKAFALLQSTRYILVMLWVTAVAASPWPFEICTLGFFVAESVTALGVCLYLRRCGMFPVLRFDSGWTRKHFIFGGKSLLSGIFVELNSRIDVLLVGLFLPDREVGIYSFAAMLVDGLFHVLAFVRINYNPVLVGYIRDREWEGARKLLRQTRTYLLPSAAGVALCVAAAFWVLTTYFVPGKDLHLGLVPLSILLAGLTIISAFIPFDNLMLVSGHPGLQTLQHLTLVVSSIGFNIALIPLLGISGAAFGTALGYVFGVSALLCLANRMLGWNLLTNRIRVQS